VNDKAVVVEDKGSAGCLLLGLLVIDAGVLAVFRALGKDS
jgi:hypothetical protein